MGLKGMLAGEILGPRPGLVILSFFGGRVEIILRFLAILLGSLPVLIAAAVALSTLRNVDSVDKFTDDSGKLRDNTYAATGVAIAVACLGIILEVVLIVLRFLNIGLLNLKSKIFLLVDIVISFLLASGHFTAGVLEAFYGSEWNDGSEDSDKIRNSMIASSVFCFIGTALFVLLGVFMVIFLMKDWNSKIVKATVKEAVTG